MKKFLTVLFVVASLLIMTGCADSPKDVTKKWLQAISEGNLEEANKYSAANVQLVNTFLIAGVNNDPSAKAKMQEGLRQSSIRQEITGDTALVYIDGNNEPITLKKIDGEWKVYVQK